MIFHNVDAKCFFFELDTVYEIKAQYGQKLKIKEGASKESFPSTE